MTPYFMRGAASVFSLFPNREPFQSIYQKYSSQSDAELLRNDWVAIGKDLENAINETLKEYESNKR